MFVRTTVGSVTFTRPFALAGHDGVQPAGTYSVETDDELIQTASVTAYRRLSTLMRFPAGSDAAGSSRIVAIDAADLAAALVRDARPLDTMAAPAQPGEPDAAPATTLDFPAADAPRSRRSRWLCRIWRTK